MDFSIAGFYSNTRNHTTFQTIKDFDADWQIGKQVIGSAEAIGYTRIGTAIRHATSLLSDRKNPHKWLMILSDGKPNDFDRYEGKYGVEDVKQALKELYALNINTYAYAIETNARHYLPNMFGANHFQIISSPSDVVAAFTKLFLKIKQSI
ncbi:MAG: VWA domain-containing protein [Saprospiraceae bacterium]|nr:VWA domain-containing protein [Saprospiraceae bacterium]